MKSFRLTVKHVGTFFLYSTVYPHGGVGFRVCLNLPVQALVLLLR